jgi:hypothetical protein
MLGKPDSGPSVDSFRLGAASNSMPPARSCDSISGAHYHRAREQFPSEWPPSGARDSARRAGVPHRLRRHQMIAANETILGNPRNHPETNGG